jgi:cytochrome c peroxidase
MRWRAPVAVLAFAAALGACRSRAPDDGIESPRPVHLVRPPNAPLSAMALLGRSIFFDSSLAADGRRSCASCHNPRLAYASADLPTGGSVVRAIPSLAYAYRAPSFGIGPDVSDVDEPSPTRAPTSNRDTKIAGTARPNTLVAHGGLFWDGRVNTLQDQAMGPLFNPNEMGNRDAASVRDRLHRANYAQRFVELFGVDVFAQPARLVDEAMFAVARFQIEDLSFHSYDSKYDAYLEGRAKLSLSEWRGLQAFDDPKRGNCAACHIDRPRGDGLPPVFTDYEYEALGIPNDAARARRAGDLGACGPLRADLRSEPRFCGQFRTPSLRNVATRTRFFHNGAYRTLADVLAFYNFRDTHPDRVYPAGSTLPPEYRMNLDTADAPFGRAPGQRPAMTDEEMRDIVAFLHTLTDGYHPIRP